MTSPRSDETQPLLDNRARQEQISDVVVDEAADEESSQPISQFRLVVSLLVDSIPGSYKLPSSQPETYGITVILSYSLQNSIQATAILIAARIGPEELSVASVALMLAFVTGEKKFYLWYIFEWSEIP